jgi:transposase
MRKRYFVELTPKQRERLERRLRTEALKPTERRRIQILLKADRSGPAWTDARIAEAVGCHARTVEGVRRRFAERGLDSVSRKAQAAPSRKRTLDGEAEARLIALACSEAPDGRSRWTLRLLSERAVALEIVDAISHETVRRTLKKTS